MLAEWSAECGPDAPMLVVPWVDAASGARFVDLRAEPYDLAEIPEAEQHPALARALRSLNATRSPLLSAKCDAWVLSPDHRADDLRVLRAELDQEPELAAVGFGSYIDLLWRDRAVFASAHLQQERLDRLIRRAERLLHDTAALACVLRPALLDRGAGDRGGGDRSAGGLGGRDRSARDRSGLNRSAPLEGFAFTVYVSAVGPDRPAASSAWESALTDVVEVLRSRELELARGSATID